MVSITFVPAFLLLKIFSNQTVILILCPFPRYELVVFTASMEIYGAAVADKLDDNRGILRRRYYRQHCTPEMGSYTKDLATICSDLASVFILDNSPGAYRSYPRKNIFHTLLNVRDIHLSLSLSVLCVCVCFCLCACARAPIHANTKI
jgi:hypothetical protein